MTINKPKEKKGNEQRREGERETGIGEAMRMREV